MKFTKVTSLVEPVSFVLWFWQFAYYERSCVLSLTGVACALTKTWVEGTNVLLPFFSCPSMCRYIGFVPPYRCISYELPPSISWIFVIGVTPSIIGFFIVCTVHFLFKACIPLWYRSRATFQSMSSRPIKSLGLWSALRPMNRCG